MLNHKHEVKRMLLAITNVGGGCYSAALTLRLDCSRLQRGQRSVLVLRAFPRPPSELGTWLPEKSLSFLHL